MVSWSMIMIASWSMIMIASWSMIMIASWSMIMIASWSMIMIASWSMIMIVSWSMIMIVRLIFCISAHTYMRWECFLTSLVLNSFNEKEKDYYRESAFRFNFRDHW